MASYYGVTRTDEYLAHYGIKGMKWGVHKAIEKGDSKALKRHYEKAQKKLHKLYDRADLAQQKINRRNNVKLAGLSGAATALGGLNISLAKDRVDRTLSAINAGLGGALIGANIGSAMYNHYNMGSKGHAKAVKDVNDWSKAMNETFKSTKYGKKPIKQYNDTYKLVDYGQLKRHGTQPKVIAQISGSHLTRNYKGKDKDDFLNTYKNKSLSMLKTPTTGQRNYAFDGWEVDQGEYFGKKKRKR